MSNNAKRPKGYTDRKAQDVRNEYVILCGQLGDCMATQDRAAAKEEELRDKLAQLGAEFEYASKAEANQAPKDDGAPSGEQAAKTEESPAQ